MPGLYRDEGVVLRAIKLGEADRIVTIFTQGHGKIRAVAKGIRKTTSKFGARLEPMSRVALRDAETASGEPADDMTDEEMTDGEHELVAFDLEEGGTVCRSCARGGGRPLTPGGLALLRRVLGGGLNGALAETPGPAAHEV